MKHLEDREQIAIFTLIRLMSTEHPILRTIYHCPNGGHRDIRTAAKFKAKGVRPGVWDVFVPCPAPGLFIEMKVGKGRLTPGQVAFREDVELHGYKFLVAYDWISAARGIAQHCNLNLDV